VNSPAPGDAELVAVNARSRLLPSGSVKVNLTVSPELGTLARAIDIVAGGAPGV